MSRNVVDTNVVQLKFDNKQFEQGCKESMETLEKLKKKIDNTGSGDALNGLGKAANNIDLSKLSANIDVVNKRFSALGIAGMTALSEITKSAMNLAHNILTVIPNQIRHGGWNRAMNIENAKFQLEGLSIAWSKVGEQISNAVSGTAFGMDQAAKAASQLAAAGVDIGTKFKEAFDYKETGKMIDEMEMALSAISGVAAQTNSSYDDIARVFMQVSATGKLMTQDMNQISARGVNVVATLAQQLGKTQSEIRDMVSKGKIDFKMFSEAMYDAFAKNAFKANNTFKGALDNMKAALSRTGEYFSGPIIRQMIPVWNSLREAVNRANTEVQIFSSNKVGDRAKAEENVKELTRQYKILQKTREEGAISNYEYETKNLELQKKLKAANNEYLKTFGMFEKMLIYLRKGTTALIDKADFSWIEPFGYGIVNILKAIHGIFSPMISAFNSAFGDKNKSVLMGVSEAFEKLTSYLILSNKEMAYLKITWQGFFDVAEAITSIFGDLLGALLGVDTTTFGLREHILFVTAVIGKLLSNLAELIKSLKVADKVIFAIKTSVTVVAGAFLMLGSAMAKITKDIVSIVKSSNSFADALIKIKDNLKENVQNGKEFIESLNPEAFDKVSEAIDRIKSSVTDMTRKIKSNTFVVKAFDKIEDKIESVSATFKKAKDSILDGLTKIKKSINELFSKKSGSKDNVSTTEVNDVVRYGDATVQTLQKVDLTEKKTEDTTKSFIQTIEDFAASIDVGKLAAIGFTAAVAGIGFKIAQSFDAFAKSTNEVTKTFKTLREGGIIGLIFGVKQQPKPSKIKEIALVIGMLSASLAGLAFVPADGLKRAGIAMAAVAGGMTVIVGAMTAFQAVLGPGATLSFTSSLFSIAGSVGILSASLAALSLIKVDNIDQLVMSLSALMLTITVFSAALSKAAPAASVSGLALIGMATSMLILVKALKKLDELPIVANWKDEKYKGIWGKTGLLVTITGALVLISGVAAKLGTNSLLGIVLALGSLKLIIPLADKVAEEIKNSIFADWFNKLVAFFGNFPKWLKDLGPYILSAITVGALIAGAVIVFKKIKNYIFSIGTSIAGIGKESSKWAGINKLLSRLSLVPVIIALTGMMVAIAGLTIVLSKIKLTYLNQAITVFAVMGAMFLTVGVVAKLTENAKTGPVLSSIIGITVIFSELIVLSMLMAKHKKDVWESVGAMSAIMLSFGSMLALATKFQKNTNGLYSILAASFVLVELGYSIKMFSDIPWKTLWSSVVAMSTTMLTFGSTLALIGKLGQTYTANKLKGMIEGAVVIAAIGTALALATLSEDWAAIGVAGLAMSGVLIVFASTLSAIGQTKFKKDGIMALASVALTAVAIGGALALATLSNDWASIGVAALAMSGVMVVFTSMIMAVSKMSISPTAFIPLVGICASSLVIATSLAKVAQYDWSSILASVVSMGAVMAAAVVAVGVLGALGESGIGVIGAALLLGLAAALYVIGKAMSITLPAVSAFIEKTIIPLRTMENDMPVIALGLSALAASLAALGASGLVLSNGAAGLILGGTGLSIITTSLVQLQNANLPQIALGLTALAGGLSLIGLAGTSLAIGSTGLILGGSGLLVLSNAIRNMAGADIVTIATGLSELTKPMIVLSGLGPLFLAGAPGVVLMSSSIILLGTAVKKVMDIVDNDLVKKLTLVPQQTTKLGYYSMVGYHKGLVSVANSGSFKSNLLAMANILPTAFRKVLDIHSPSRVMNMIGKYGIVGFMKGVTDGSLWTEFKNAVKTDLNAILGMFQKAADAISKFFKGKSNIGDAMSDFASSAGIDKGIVDDLKDSFGDLDLGLDDVTEGMDNFSTASGKAGKSAGKMKEEVDESANAYEQLRSNIENAIKGFDKFDTTVDVSKNDILSNMQSQVDGVLQWTSMLTDLQAKGLSGALLQYLGDLGPQGYKYVAAFETMTLDELANANALFAQKMALDDYAASRIMNSYALSGNQVAQGFVNGLTQNQQMAITAVATMGQDALSAFNQVWGIHSPSRVMAQNGMYIILGLRNSLRDNWTLVNSTATTMCKITISKIKSEFSIAKGREIGLQICNGIRNGIANGSSSVINAAVNMASSALNRVKDALGIHSPSRAFMEIGMWIDKGLAKGVNRFSYEVGNATESVADDSLKFMNEAIKRIVSGIDDSPELSPVIRPRLDLTKIQNAKSRINGMVGDNSYTIAAGISASKEARRNATVNAPTGREQVTQNFTFNQTNNSPKALDRMEIRRQTRNLLGQIQGATI